MLDSILHAAAALLTTAALAWAVYAIVQQMCDGVRDDRDETTTHQRAMRALDPKGNDQR